MQNIQNNRLSEIIKENEKTITEFTKELQSGFSQKTITYRCYRNCYDKNTGSVEEEYDCCC